MILTIALVFIGGLLLLIFNVTIVEDVVWRNVINALATIFIVSSLWTFVNQYQVQKNFHSLHEQHTDKILSAIAALDVASKVGFHQIHAAVDDFDFVTWIKNSKSITILVDDLDPWLTRYHTALDERLKDLRKSTTFIIYKSDKDQEKNNPSIPKINLKLSELVDMGIPKSKFTLLGFSSKVNCQIYMSENLAVVAPLVMGIHKVKPIGLVFMKTTDSNCYYKKVDSDLNAIKISSHIL